MFMALARQELLQLRRLMILTRQQCQLTGSFAGVMTSQHGTSLACLRHLRSQVSRFQAHLEPDISCTAFVCVNHPRALQAAAIADIRNYPACLLQWVDIISRQHTI